jgi:AP-1 complex subunit mu
LVRVPPAVTGAVSWRSENIKYPKNEVFIDVIEKVNMLVASNGTLLRSEIVGQILIKSKLSGMPELRLGLNDRVQFDTSKREVRDPNASNANANATTLKRAIEMEDVTFHQCVRLNKFETERIISFIPPDGDFELMSYRLSTSIRPLIWIEAVIDAHAHSRVEYFIKAKSQFKPRSTANNVEIVIPVPPDADSPKFRASIGSVKYVPERNALVWSIRQFQGGKEFMLRAHFGLPSLTNEEEEKQKRPITVNFEIPYFTVSGIQVRYLKILEKTGYRALPWVRYITRAGEYQIRTN